MKPPPGYANYIRNLRVSIIINFSVNDFMDDLETRNMVLLCTRTMDYCQPNWDSGFKDFLGGSYCLDLVNETTVDIYHFQVV